MDFTRLNFCICWHLSLINAKVEGMNIIAKYLDKEVGRATKLAAKLGMSLSQISQFKSGFRPIPYDRMRDIEKATDGALKFDDMLAETLKVRSKARKARAAARAKA